MEEFFLIEDKVKKMHKIFLILEYCSGGELFDRIVQTGVFDESTAKMYITQILKGLEYMHAKNYVHRDLKVLFHVL
jgi:serine/threonine protein kinase